MAEVLLNTYTINHELLLEQCRAQFGLLFGRLNSTSLLVTDENVTVQQIEVFLQAHSDNQESETPDKTDEQLAEIVRAGAKSQIQGIPGWFKWDEETALAWHDEHVGDVIDPVPDDLTGLSQLQLVGHIETLIAVNKSMNTELRAMARMMIALRNELNPDLQD
jgi:hypothetical protein